MKLLAQQKDSPGDNSDNLGASAPVPSCLYVFCHMVLNLASTMLMAAFVYTVLQNHTYKHKNTRVDHANA